MTTLATKRTVLIDNQAIEFPNLNQEYYGHKSRYCYMVIRPKKKGDGDQEAPMTAEELENNWMTGFIKFDQEKDKIAATVSFGDNHTGDEVYYQQRDGSDPRKDEDDGYLMTTVHNWKTNLSQFIMWDAKTLKVVLVADLETSG